MKTLGAWQRVIALFGLFKSILGIGAFVAAIAAGSVPNPVIGWLLAAHVVAYAAAAVILLAGARRDARAGNLGTLLALVASAFGEGLLEYLRATDSPALGALRAVFAIKVDALTPWFLWTFVAEFPRPVELERGRQFVRWALSGTLVAGIVLIVANLAWYVASRVAGAEPLAGTLSVLAARGGYPIYWTYIYAFSLGALVMLAVRARTSRQDERRRVQLLGYGIAVGAAPGVIWTIGVLVSPWFARTFPRSAAGWFIYPALLSVPFTVAYAVLVHQALDVRIVLRRALRYATARGSLIALTTVPFVLLGLELYRRRDQSVANVIGGAGGLLLIALAMLGVAAIRARRRMLDWLDRRFFREQYDAQQILTRLVERIQRAASAGEVADVIRVEVDRALHLSAVHLLVLDAAHSSFWSQGTKLRPLPADSALVGILQSRDGALDAAVDSAGTLFNDLSETDQLWLTDAGARLLVGLKSADRRLNGVLVFGDKRSELPFSPDDRALLVAVASAAALSLGVSSGDPAVRSPARDPATEDAMVHSAVECTHCGTLFPVGTAECTVCEHATMPAPVPLIVAGKFRVRQRIGRGAMGIVYRAVDLALDRPVAIKTLPRMQAEQAARLRREARAVASLSHPALAAIYGAESWLGMPMLVLEYLSGGTLADRLTRGPIAMPEALSIGLTLSDGLRAIHAAGVLHRDIKPSNIGFGADGSPRILDFGLSRLLSGAHEADPWDSATRDRARDAIEASHDEMHATSTAEGQIVGTPLYMSPEAVAAESPAPSFDVWGLTVVLYEAIAGENPLREPTVPAILNRIRSCDVPPITQFMPNAPPPLVRFFGDALHPDRGVRPGTAEILARRIAALQGDLGLRG